MKPSADVVALIDDVLEDAAALRLRVSLDRCRRSVDDLLSGYGPNPHLSQHGPGPGPCDCRAPAKENLIFAATDPTPVGNDRITWRITFPVVGSPDGSGMDMGLSDWGYWDFTWDPGEREAAGNPTPQPLTPPYQISHPPDEPMVVLGQPARGRTHYHHYSQGQARLLRDGILWHTIESVDITRTVN